MKRTLKHIAYHSGLLHQHHRRRNRKALTVVLFHRVLPPGSPEWAGADPEWTVSTDFFEDCLRFFRRHYNVVGFPEVMNNYLEHTPLPDNPLLITFDDGWKCNLQHAAPLLKKFGFPAMLFVTTGALGKPILSWQEALYALWKTGSLEQHRLRELEKLLDTKLPHDATGESNYEELLGILRRLPPLVRRRIDERLTEWTTDLPGLPYMLTHEELEQLQEQGFHLGTHGVTHESLIHVEDAHGELHISRQTLKEITGNREPVHCFSPPQGLYDQNTLKDAEKAGYLLACTSRKGLNSTRRREGFIDLGRININQLSLKKANGRLSRPKLAALLFRQPILEY